MGVPVSCTIFGSNKRKYVMYIVTCKIVIFHALVNVAVHIVKLVELLLYWLLLLTYLSFPYNFVLNSR